MERFNLVDGWLYTPDYENRARYLLGRPGRNNLCCFGVNPSTAKPDNLDNTLKTVSAMAGKKGYDGWIMMNLYPQRATNPNDMHTEIDSEMHQRNMRDIEMALKSFDNLVFWAAWGTLIKKRPYLGSCLREIAGIAEDNARWVTYGKRSVAGHPHHPLYLRHDSIEQDFCIDEYLR